MVTAALAAAVVFTGPAAAQERTGYTRIAAGDFAGAQAELEQERRTYPRSPELLLNLAAVYRRAGRLSEARSLYRSVLARGPVDMEMPAGGVASSYDLARIGIERLDAARISAR